MDELRINSLVAEKIKEIEEKEKVKILYAAESGSRSWKVAAPDSDYDIRFIYLRKPEDYLRLDKKSDVLDFPIEGNWDLSGWDLYKTLTLLKNSNPRLFEWFNSPIVYTNTDFADRFQPLMNKYFSPRNIIMHYLHTAKHQREHFLQGDMIKIKKYLYALHPLLAAKWVLDHTTPPPVVFRDLMNAELSANMHNIVEDLLYKKINFPEKSETGHINELDKYINEEILKIENKVKLINKDDSLGWEPLNDFFLSELEIASNC